MTEVKKIIMDLDTHPLVQRVRRRRNQLDLQMRIAEALNKNPHSQSSRTHIQLEVASQDCMDQQETERKPVSTISREYTKSLNEISLTAVDDTGQTDGSGNKVQNKEKFIRSQLKRLGVLYSDSQISSPIHVTESTFSVETKVSNSPKPTALVAKLAALADNIKQWEDEFHCPLRGNKPEEHKNSCMSESNVSRQVETSPSAKMRPYSSTKRVTWDENISQNSETEKKSPAYKITQETTKPSARFVPERTVDGDTTNLRRTRCKRRLSSLLSTSCTGECFESKDKVSAAIGSRKYGSSLDLKKTRASYSMDTETDHPDDTSMENNGTAKAVEVDPLELSVSERKALFERNQGQALLPKTPFSLYSPTKYLERAFYTRVHL